MFNGADIARRDLGGIEIEGISDKQAEFWLNSFRFAPNHSKRPNEQDSAETVTVIFENEPPI